MTEFRPSDREVNRVIRSWLREDRQEDVSRIAGVVLDQLDATPQRRTTWWPAWRTPTMNKFLAIGLGAAAVVAVLLIGSNLLGSGSPTPGGPPSESVAPSEAEPSVEPSPATAPPLSQSFTSNLHGYSVSYPEGWTAQAATEPWTDPTFPLEWGQPHADWLSDPVLESNLFLAIASQPIGDSTPDDWVAEQMASGEGCAETEPISVDGATGLIGAAGYRVGECKVATVTIDGRGYWIQLLTSDDDPDAVAPYDRAWFEELLATVQLQPEDAID